MNWNTVAYFARACPRLRELDVEHVVLPTPTDTIGLGGVAVLRAGLESTRKSLRPELQSMRLDAFISLLEPPLCVVKLRWVGKDPPEPPYVAQSAVPRGLDFKLEGVEMEVQAEEEDEASEMEVEAEEEDEDSDEEVEVDAD